MKKPIIIICGSNHSGTSAVAEFLVRHGGHIGKHDSNISATSSYLQFENTMFKNWCKTKIGGTLQPEEIVNDNELKQYISEQPVNRPLILKYPKSSIVLHLLPKFNRRVKVIYIIRNPYSIISSTMNKTQMTGREVIEDMAATYDAITRNDLQLYIVMIERLRHIWYCKKLLTECMLKNKNVNPVNVSRLSNLNIDWKNNSINSKNIPIKENR